MPHRVKRLVDAAPGPKALMRAARSGALSARRPISEPVEQYLREQAPDAVLVTPLLEPGSVQAEFLRAANRHGRSRPASASHSWDNLTNKGLIHELPDAVTVWNEMQRDEAVKLHRVPAERVVVTGRRRPTTTGSAGSRAARARSSPPAVGLDPERPFVLYLGSSGFIAPDEAGFIVEWMRELQRAGLDDLQVLARPHPVNPLARPADSQVELAGAGQRQALSPRGRQPDRRGVTPGLLRLALLLLRRGRRQHHARSSRPRSSAAPCSRSLAPTLSRTRRKGCSTSTTCSTRVAACCT